VLKALTAWLIRMADEHFPYQCFCEHWVWGRNNAKLARHRMAGHVFLCPECHKNLYGGE
jgi:predicted SprT family Zn-dependent metalloprotease